MSRLNDDGELFATDIVALCNKYRLWICISEIGELTDDEDMVGFFANQEIHRLEPLSKPRENINAN